MTQGIFSEIARNELVIRVQPGESVYLKMNSKSPGLHMKTVPTELDLSYRRRFSDLKIPEAYEALILDALHGDHSNFVRNGLFTLRTCRGSKLTRGQTSSTCPGRSSPRSCTTSAVRPPLPRPDAR